MRIGFSTSVIQGGKSGIAEHVLCLLRTFSEQARMHQFVLFVLERDLPLFEFAKGPMRLVPVSERYRPPLRDILWHQAVLPRLAKRHELDVLHVPSYRRLLWRRPCGLVGTVHDLAAFHVPGKYDWKRMWYGRVGAAVLARRQDEIITVSETSARDISAHWRLPPERVTVIYNGINCERFSGLSQEAARAACASRFKLEHPFLFYVARLEHPGKNHVRLIRAFDAFKAQTQSPWQLGLAGGDWHGAEQIHAAVRHASAREDIRCLGFVSQADLPLLYRAAGMCVYPSLYEGFGFPPLQAMASGCPVICSNRGALREVAGTAALLVDPEDVAGIAAQITRLAADPHLRSELARRGLLQARQFDWRRAATDTLKVYTRAVARAQARTAGRSTRSASGSQWRLDKA
ncbi:MAG TPA: glycosyltransferase family 1 protein [Candidatus Acidoferrum sp.]|nr:glycosyltransferase family 1 protein [Candidatus Acidoferrum sp.]